MYQMRALIDLAWQQVNSYLTATTLQILHGLVVYPKSFSG